MEIFVNGQPDIVSTDDDVTIGELVHYLREQFAKQRFLVRFFALDGVEYVPEEAQAVESKTPADFQKMEVTVGSFLDVGTDIMNELAEKTPILASEAVAVTEELQSGKVVDAKQRLKRFANTANYIVNAISGVCHLNNIRVGDVTDGTDIEENLTKFGGFLRDVQVALESEDMTTVGDVMEFDVSPQISSVTELMQRLAKLLAEKSAAEAQQDGAKSS